MNHNIRAVFDRAQKGGRSEGRVHHQRQMVLFCNRRIALDVRNVEAGIADGFDVERAGFFVDCRFHRRKIVDVCEADGDSLLRQDCVKLGEGSAVKIVGGDDFVSEFCNVGERKVDCRRAGGKGQCRRAAVERRQTLFQNIIGRIHQPGVDVSGLLKRKEVGAVLRVAEAVCGGAVHRNRAGKRGRVGGLSGVDRQGFKMVFFIVH